jgi:hypothetical protein
MQPPEAERRRHYELPARARALAFGRAFGFLDVGKDAPDTLEIARADIGQRDLARGSLQQTRTETLLQRRDQPRHRRWRQFQLARRRREPLAVGHRDEGVHGVDPVHAIIS